jgi:hypothetical protein
MGLGIPEMMAIGGGVGLLTGGLRGGLQGAALGGIGGGLNNYLQGGSFLQSAAAKPIASAAASAAPATAAQFEAAMGLPSSAMIGAGAPLASAMPTGAGMGLVQGASGNLVNPEYFLGAGTPFETFKGGQGLLANATGNLLDTLPDYVTPTNVLGAASIISNMQQPQYQMPAAQGGGVRQGSTQGLNVDFGGAKPIKRRGQA